MNRLLACLLLAIVVLAQANLSAQSTAPTDMGTQHIDFDVASFRRDNSAPVEHRISLPYNGDGFTAVNVSVRDLLRYAFAGSTGKPFGVYGQPAWVDTERYDLQAKIATEEIGVWQRLNSTEKRQVLKGLLARSLALKYRADETIRPFYALTVEKSGLKMQENTEGSPFPTGRSICHYMPGNTFVGESCTMEGLADLLSFHTDAPVLNRTGLIGGYSFTMTFESAPMPGASSSHEFGPNSLPPETATPLIRSALKQIGLELVPNKGQIDGIVIGSIQRPPTD